MNDKLEKYYSYLKGIEGVDVAPTVEEFRYAMQDPNKREKYYNYLKGFDNVDVAPTYDSFTKTLVPDALIESMQGASSQGVEPAGKQKAPTSGVSPSPSVSGDSSSGLSEFETPADRSKRLSPLYEDFKDKELEYFRAGPELYEASKQIEQYKDYYDKESNTYMFPDEETLNQAQPVFERYNNAIKANNEAVQKLQESVEVINESTKPKEVTEEYKNAWEDVPQEFKQQSSTVNGNVRFQLPQLPETNLFIPKEAVDGIYNAMVYGPTKNLPLRVYTAKITKDALLGYNRGLANGQINNNLRQNNVDFERVAELQRVIKKNSPSKEYTEFMEGGNEGMFKRLAKDPLGIMATITIESLAGQVAAATTSDLRAVGAGAVVGSVVPGVGTAVGALSGFAGATSEALETSSFIMQSLQEAGYDVSNADDLRAAFENKEFINNIKAEGEKRGLPVAALDALSMGIAGKLPIKGVMRKILAEQQVQGVLGAAGETIKQAAFDDEFNLPAITSEYLGELVGGTPEIVSGMLASKPNLLAKPSSQTIDGRKTLDEAQTAVEQDVQNAPDWLKPELAKKAKEITEAKNKLVNQDAEFYSGFSDEDKNAVSDINERLFEVQDILEGDQELSEGTRKAYEAEATKLLEQKFAIEEKYIDKPTPSTEKVTEVTKTEEDAIQERETEEVPVGEEAEVGEEMVGEVREQAEEVRGEEEKIIDPAYHGGNLEYKAEGYGSRMMGSDVPYTGYYFHSDKKKAEGRGNRTTGKKEVRTVDFSKYNLWKPKNSSVYFVVNSALKKIPNIIDSEERMNNVWDEMMSKLNEAKGYGIEGLDEVINLLNKNEASIKKSIIENSKKVEERRNKPKDGTNVVDQSPTVILKELGFEGIDVRNIEVLPGDANPDSDQYGSVLFDLKEVTAPTKEVKSKKETKARAEELKSKIKDRLKGKKLGFAYDPKQQAKEDLDFFKDVVELASIYIQQGVKNAEQFAKKAGIEFNRLSREAFKAAKKGNIEYDEQNIWEVMSAIIPKKKKKTVESNRKAVQRKYKKGDYTNIQDEVAAFIDLPLHRISDQALLNQVNETLANARKGKVNPKELTELTQQVKENLNQQELSTDPNDFTPERLNERLGNIPERIGKIKDDDFDKNTLKDSRSRFSRLINDLRFLENVNNILFELKQLTQDQFQENQKAIADARAKLNEKAKNADANIQEALKELNKENENKAKVYRPQDVTDDPILENEVRNFFEAIEDYDSDDISLALEVADIFDDLEVGYIPVGKMAEIANTITATVAANSEGMKKAKDNIASMPKEKSGFIARAFEMFNPVRKASVDFQEWVNRFRNQEFWSWENILGVNKESPIYKLLNDVVTQGEAYSESVATEMAALYKALKFPVLRKGIAGKERLEGAYKQFMKNLSSPENREKRVMVGMIMIERRFRELYDKPFWNNVMSDKDKTNRLSGKKDKLLGGVSEKEIYEKAYAKLPKNEDGTIDLEAAFKQVRKDKISNSLINFLEEKFDENGELAQKQKVANQKRGLPTDFGRFYFPFLRKGGISQETKEFDFNDFFSAVNPKIASDRGKDIKDSSYSMMEADPLRVFSDYIHQVNRDYHLTDAIRTAYKFFNQAIKDSEGEAKTVFSAMKDALKYNVAWAFQAPDSTITDKLLQASYAYYLTTMYRAVAEPTSEMIRSIGAGEINTKMLKYAYDEGMSSIKDMFAKVKGLRLNENGEIETTGEFRSNFKKLLDFTNSPFRRQFSRQFADGSIRTSAKRDAGLFEKTSNMIMGFPNRATLFSLWMPAFDNRYKEITGKDFDYTKIDDENYLKENRKDIRDAAAYADKNTARYKGYATALGGRTMNKAFALPFIPIWRKTNIDALKDPGLFKMNQFLGSFGWRDSFNIAEGLRDIALSLGDNMTSEDLKKYMTDNPTTALRTITALIASGISYPIIMRMMAYLDAKDEDEEDLPQWKKDMVKDVEENGFFTIEGMIQESLGYATFLATSKYGYSSRFGTLTLLGIIQNQLLNQKKFATEEEKKKIDAAIDRINETSKAFLFSEPINLTGSGQWGAATPAKDVIEMIPGYGLPMQFGIQLERSINTVIKAEERGTDEQQKAAYILAANDLIKTALLFGGGTVLPAGKEIDRIATGKKIKLSEELTEKKGGSLNLENLKPSLPEMPSIF